MILFSKQIVYLDIVELVHRYQNINLTLLYYIIVMCDIVMIQIATIYQREKCETVQRRISTNEYTTTSSFTVLQRSAQITPGGICK